MTKILRTTAAATALVTILAGGVLVPSLASAQPEKSPTHSKIVRTQTRIIYRVVPSYSDELPPDTGVPDGGAYRGGPCYRCW